MQGKKTEKGRFHFKVNFAVRAYYQSISANGQLQGDSVYQRIDHLAQVIHQLSISKIKGQNARDSVWYLLYE